MPEETQSSHFSPEAESAFAAHLADVEAGRGGGFESLCNAHPELAGELCALKAQWEQVAGVVQHLLQDPPRANANPEASAPIGSRCDADPAGPDFVQQLAEHSPPSSRYELRGEFARGGMGAILKVWDKDLRRDLAMKVVLGKEDAAKTGSTPAVDAPTLGRFLEEAQVTGQLDHPGVVPVHELGVDARGRVYFTMRLVKGRDLAEVLELLRAGKEGWTRTRALGVLLKVCEAMAYAHSKGVVHRDLKPSNVMVGRFGEVYVMDWGLAKVHGRQENREPAPPLAAAPGLSTVRSEEAAETPGSPLLTKDGTVVGTPSYMPPEQARGRLAELGPRADVYSLGAILYELLTGARPYVRPDTRPAPHAIVAKLLQGPPTPIEELVKDVPAELVAICERAMARDPAQRYADVSALAEDLSAFLEHRVVSAYRTGAVAELLKWVERNRGLATAIASILVAVIAGMVTSLVFKARSDRNAELAGKNEKRAMAGEALARSEKERAEASERRAIEGERVANERADDVLRLSALQDLDDLTARANRLWPATPELVERYQLWLSDARQLLEKQPRFEAQLADLRTRALPWTVEELAKLRADHPKRKELDIARRQVEYIKWLKKAQEFDQPVAEPSPQEVAVDYSSLPAKASEINNLAWQLVDPERKNWGGEARGLVLARRAVELATELTPAERAGIRDTLSWALFANGRYDEAIAEEEQALKEAGAGDKNVFENHLRRLEQRIEEALDPEKELRRSNHLAAIEQRIAVIEAEIQQRPEWLFATAEDKWWHNQLEKLVNGLRAFSDEETGLVSGGISAEHGWGIARRLQFARTIAERSIQGTKASDSWNEALASIASISECPLYAGLRISPQLGLLPIGRDPVSGLWEFAHLQTGEPAERRPDGRLSVKEETGLVFVLLPGGTFWMGAQANDPAGPNYDPEADLEEGPPHEVELSPFFMSKYEMTQGQWLRIAGQNPSEANPQDYLRLWNRDYEPCDLRHPVEQVSWHDCKAILDRLGLELPREVQWEYGARGGTRSIWWCGNDKESLVRAGNLADRYARENDGQSWGAWEAWDDGNTHHARVGTYEPNPFGLYDVIGNVWEWCEDQRSSGSSDRNNRGGGFYFLADSARSASRSAVQPSITSFFLGLRPSRTIE